MHRNFHGEPFPLIEACFNKITSCVNKYHRDDKVYELQEETIVTLYSNIESYCYCDRAKALSAGNREGLF